MRPYQQHVHGQCSKDSYCFIETALAAEFRAVWDKHTCLRQAASPTTPALVTKTNSKCWRLDRRNSNRHQTPQHRKSLGFGQRFWATQLLRCAFGQVTCERLHFLIQYHCNSFDSRSQGPCKGALHGIISQVSSNVPLVVCLGRILSKDKIFHRSNIVFSDRRKCLKIEGYPMESAAKEKQLQKYPARTSPHRTMKPWTKIYCQTVRPLNNFMYV